MSASIAQDINQTSVTKDDDDQLINELKLEFLKVAPEMKSLFEPQFNPEFDWQKVSVNKDDLEAVAEQDYNNKILDEKSKEQNIQTWAIAELLRVLHNNGSSPFKTDRLQKIYDEQLILDSMAHKAQQLEVLNNFAKQKLINFAEANGVDSPEMLKKAMSGKGPDSLPHMSKQFEASSKQLLDLLQDSTSLANSNISLSGKGPQKTIGESIETMNENMKQLQESALKNISAMIDNIMSIFDKK
jgi:hypothetical protein